MAVCCIPLVLAAGICAVAFWHQGTPAALPYPSQPPQVADHSAQNESDLYFRVVGEDTDLVCSDSELIEAVQRILNSLGAEQQVVDVTVLQQASQTDLETCGEDEGYTFWVTGKDGESRQYRLSGDLLLDCQEDTRYCLTDVQYAQLREALGLANE